VVLLRDGIIGYEIAGVNVMVKRLTYSKVSFIERVGALMLVGFLDDDGNLYQWAPRWADVEQVFLKQINVERFNKPESAFLNRFAHTAQSVVEGAQRITSGRKISGRFEAYENEMLVVRTHNGESAYYTPAFEVTHDFLDTWLSVTASIEFFVVNDMVIRMRAYEQVDRDEYKTFEYPPPDKPPQELSML
jgi:hypothetical protein